MSLPRALIIDDEPDICDLIEMSFLTIGIESVKAYCVSDAVIALQNGEFDVCFTDLKLPDGDGFQIIEYIQRTQPHLPVAMMTAHGNVESALEALKLGAFDFISKPFEVSHLRTLAQNAIESKESATKKERKESYHNMYGESAPMKRVRETIKRLAHSQAPVYINGESGTGKELAARAIHAESPRRDRPFIAVNCGAIPAQLVESEFFGHVKGAFTGADQDKVGLFEAADGGTIFLDEIADLPLDMQVKLLRTIQERVVRAVGGTEEVPINVRIISASHRHLEGLVLKNEFRQDLFYRLNVITLELPPLRERLDDIPILSRHLLEKINSHNSSDLTLSEAALERLTRYSFPGNVRELENILERAAAFATDGIIQPEDLKLDESNMLHKEILRQDRLEELKEQKNEEAIESPPPSTSPKTVEEKGEKREEEQYSDEIILPEVVDDLEGYLAQVEEKIIRRALAQNRNKTEAAQSLGISFRQFRYRLKKLAIEED